MPHSRLTVLIACLAAAASAQQQTTPASVTGDQPPLSTTPATGDASNTEPAKLDLPSTGMLHDGTPLKLRLRNALNSHTAKTGDRVEFEVVNNVVVGGVTVLKRGAPAVGVVTDAESSKTMGRAGRLSFMIRDIPLENGKEIPVRAFNRSGGENTTAQMVGLMIGGPIGAAPFMLLIHGSNTVFERGTEINAFVNGDVKVDLDGFSGLSVKSEFVAPVTAPERK